MNILFTPSDNRDRSGAFRSMAALADILEHKYGHHILVILPYEGSGKRLLDSKGIENILIRSYDWTIALADRRKPKVLAKCLINFLLNILAIRKISGVIKKEHIDLVHNNTSWGYVGACAALKTKTPCVWHIREFLEEDQSRRIVFKNWGYRLMSKADAVIAISESKKEKYASILGSGKIKMIFNGINPDGCYFPNHKIFNGETVRLLMVGVVCEGKGQWMAIEACELLKKKGLTVFKLRLVGDGESEYLEQLKAIIDKYGLSSIVEYCGTSSNTPQYYNSSDIYLMCSSCEAFGRVTVEAMLGGCLVIGRNSGGTGELIDDEKTGLLFNKDSVEDLADKIEYAMTHKDAMRGIAAVGQDYMLNNMTAEKNAAKINDVYKQLMEGKA